jgi:hypothetical protein
MEGPTAEQRLMSSHSACLQSTILRRFDCGEYLTRLIERRLTWAKLFTLTPQGKASKNQVECYHGRILFCDVEWRKLLILLMKRNQFRQLMPTDSDSNVYTLVGVDPWNIPNLRRTTMFLTKGLTYRQSLLPLFKVQPASSTQTRRVNSGHICILRSRLSLSIPRARQVTTYSVWFYLSLNSTQIKICGVCGGV